MTETVSILPWADEHTARKNYTCANCGGIIQRGTRYQRYVLRQGTKGVGPLSSRREHLDCTAPWYQPSGVHRFSALGSLPGRLPPAEAAVPDLSSIQVSVSVVGGTEQGNVTIVLPTSLGQRIVHAPSPTVRQAALTEIQHVFQMLLAEITNAGGSKRQSKKLSRVADVLQHVSVRKAK